MLASKLCHTLILVIRARQRRQKADDDSLPAAGIRQRSNRLTPIANVLSREARLAIDSPWETKPRTMRFPSARDRIERDFFRSRREARQAEHFEADRVEADRIQTDRGFRACGHRDGRSTTTDRDQSKGRPVSNVKTAARAAEWEGAVAAVLPSSGAHHLQLDLVAKLGVELYSQHHVGKLEDD